MPAINNALLLIMGASLRGRDSRILYRWLEWVYIDRYTQKSIHRSITYRTARSKIHDIEMRLTSRRCALLFVLALWANSSFAIDPALSLDQHVIRTWGVDQGLPQATVYALAQTADGYVWAATQEGFVRFDGTEFVTYDKAGVSQIHNNMTLALLAGRDGSLYP